MRGGERGGLAGLRDLVIAARGTLAGGGFRVGFPLRFDEAITFEAAERGIDGAAGQASDLHDVEAKAVVEADGLKDERGGVGEAKCGGHIDCGLSLGYVAYYHK